MSERASMQRLARARAVISVTTASLMVAGYATHWAFFLNWRQLPLWVIVCRDLVVQVVAGCMLVIITAAQWSDIGSRSRVQLGAGGILIGAALGWFALLLLSLSIEPVVAPAACGLLAYALVNAGTLRRDPRAAMAGLIVYVGVTWPAWLAPSILLSLRHRSLGVGDGSGVIAGFVARMDAVGLLGFGALCLYGATAAVGCTLTAGEAIVAICALVVAVLLHVA